MVSSPPKNSQAPPNPAESPAALAEHQQPQPEHGVDADLAQDRDDGGGSGAGRGIGGGQPEAQGPHPGLDQEGDAQDRGPGLHQCPVLTAQAGDPARQVGHVERARESVDHAHADQEEQGGQQVDRDVVQPGPDAGDAGAVQGQPVRGGQHDLEEHEQVEEVAGQEGAVEPHQLELEQGMKVGSRPLPVGQREHQRGKPKDAGQHQHQRGEPVQHQHDAEQRGPVAQPVHAHRGGVRTPDRRRPPGSSSRIATASSGAPMRCRAPP